MKSLNMIAMAMAMGPHMPLPSSSLAPRRTGPARRIDRPHWAGDGVKPERETRQQRRAKARKEQSK